MPPDLSLQFKGGSMSRNELVFAKKCILATRDWDTFQAILRKCLKQPASDAVREKETLNRPPQTVSV